MKRSCGGNPSRLPAPAAIHSPHRLRAIMAIAGLCAQVAGCSTAPPPAESLTVWKPLGSWSGTAVQQTDAFISDTGELRITWEARETSASPGTLRIAVHSAVSGRLLEVVVDHRGAGKDVAYFNEDPRSFFLVIEPTAVAWSVDVAEGVAATKKR
jgi:hypothetical protein